MTSMSIPRAAASLSVAVGAGLYLLRRRTLSTVAASKPVTFETLDVFTTTRFGGNPLAIVYDEQQRLSTDEMQRVAAEFGYSETTFVLPPRDLQNTAWVRIFSPTAEMPFAGHPNVGTATALAWRGEVFGRAVSTSVRLEEKAGIVPLDVLLDSAGKPAGAMLTAPEPFAIPIGSLPVDVVAAAIGVKPADLNTNHHAPLVATTGLPFIVAELASMDALTRSQGQAATFAQARAVGGPLAQAPPKVLAYVRTGSSGAGAFKIRARMHRSDGTEDAGTGSANCCLIGLLASLATSPGVVSASILQGVEMGRPSVLQAEAERKVGSSGAAAVGAVRIGGHCAAVSRGELVGWD